MSTLTLKRQPRAACIATMALVFLVGGMVGAVVMSAGHSRLHAGNRDVWTSAGQSVHLERLRKDLDLTPQQTEQMETILDDFTQLYRTVLTDGKARILQILKPEQQRKFQRMIEEAR